MRKVHFFKLVYYLGFTLLMAFMMLGSFPGFWEAWLTAIFLLPALIVLQFGLQKAMGVQNLLKRSIWIFFWAMLALYASYMALLFSYWYFLELHPESFEMILVNPMFIWITLGFFAGLERFLFKEEQKEGPRTLSIYSNRKKTVLEIDQIAYVESRGDFTLAMLKDGQEFRNKVKISYWEQHLGHFVRIHRSFLVNPELSVLHGGSVVVHKKWELPVSRGYKKAVTAYFADKAFNLIWNLSNEVPHVSNLVLKTQSLTLSTSHLTLLLSTPPEE